MLSLDNVEFLLAYLCVGGFFAVLVFAISVVSVPMMLDRNTDGIVAALTSLRAFAANVPAMIVWGLLIVVLIGGRIRAVVRRARRRRAGHRPRDVARLSRARAPERFAAPVRACGRIGG